MKKFTLVLSLIIFFSVGSLPSFAKEEDKNIVIENKQQTFKFQTAKGDHPVVIKEAYQVKYRCNEIRDAFTFVEMYNDQETIDDVSIYTEGKKNKYIIPKYDYYSVQDIFYSDARVCYFGLPLGKAGAVSEVKLEKTHKDPRYFSRVFFTEDFFVENKVITIVIPRWMSSEIKEFNFAGSQITKTVEYNSKEDADVYTYTAKDVVPFASERYAPGASYIYPHLLILNKEATTSAGNITYFKTIKDQYNWCYSLVKQVQEDDAPLKAKALEITNGITGDDNKVKAIYNWVHNNIRYIAFEDGIAGFKPAKAADVLSKKYGDCKGMANLIKGLLKGIDLDARLCWIGTNHIAYDLSTPVLSVHNHMIAAWMYKGKPIFLDGTETYIGLNEYAERIAGRQVLVEDGENYILTNIPVITAKQNLDFEKRVLSINNTDLVGKANHMYKGEARTNMLNQIHGVKKDNLDKAFNKYLSEDNEDYKITNLVKPDYNTTDTSFNISYDVQFKNGVSVFGNELYVEMEFRKDLDKFIIDTAKRKTDMVLHSQLNIQQETELQIPTGYKATALPADFVASHPNIEIALKYKQVGNKLLYNKSIIVKKVYVKKQDFKEWNTMMKQLSEKYKEQVVLSK